MDFQVRRPTTLHVRWTSKSVAQQPLTYDGLPSPSPNNSSRHGLPSPSLKTPHVRWTSKSVAQQLLTYDGLPSPSPNNSFTYDGLPSPSLNNSSRTMDFQVRRPTTLHVRWTSKSVAQRHPIECNKRQGRATGVADLIHRCPFFDSTDPISSFVATWTGSHGTCIESTVTSIQHFGLILASIPARADETLPQTPPVLLQMIRDDSVHRDLGLSEQQRDQVLSLLREVDGPWFRSRNSPADQQHGEVMQLTATCANRSCAKSWIRISEIA